jgi:ornithine carbamoyltransferase
MRSFLKIKDFSLAEAREVLQLAEKFKVHRGSFCADLLKGKTYALVFSKSSTRTRVSFEVGIREMGGQALFLNANDIQLGRGEPIIDTARVLGKMVHGAVIRTYGQEEVDLFARYSGLVTINALTDEEHPCQILTDIFTYERKHGSIKGRKVVFVGDADCNVARSFVHAAELFDFKLICAAPDGYQSRIGNANTTLTASVRDAAKGADLLYTDVWISMGKEAEARERAKAFQGYQISEELLRLAKPDCMVLHCLPAYRGKEITEEVLESRAGDIFEQAGNRLPVQQGIIAGLLGFPQY